MIIIETSVFSVKILAQLMYTIPTILTRPIYYILLYINTHKLSIYYRITVSLCVYGLPIVLTLMSNEEQVESSCNKTFGSVIMHADLYAFKQSPKSWPPSSLRHIGLYKSP